ncbi:MAG: hypothetical protein JST64_06590 [Actinobacteria bacterium]|nr:hypothetical protein [Actinomycetota bacterium]
MRDLIGSITESVDRRAPGFVRFLAALRWGGLRTIRPDVFTCSLESAAAVGAGVGARAAVSAASRGRVRPPLATTVALGAIATHLCVWRWDTLRWRRSRVALVVDLPVSDLVRLAEDLTAAGMPVERWERGVRSGRRVHGLWCRTGDVRAVNRSIDAAGSATGSGAGAERESSALSR